MRSTLRGSGREKHEAPRLCLSDAMQRLATCKVDQLMENLALKRQHRHGSHLSRVNDRAIEESTKKAYKKHYRGLEYFFSLIGDYLSLIILQLDAPDDPPSIDLSSICKSSISSLTGPLLMFVFVLYIDYRTLSAGSQ